MMIICAVVRNGPAELILYRRDVGLPDLPPRTGGNGDDVVEVETLTILGGPLAGGPLLRCRMATGDDWDFPIGEVRFMLTRKRDA